MPLANERWNLADAKNKTHSAFRTLEASMQFDQRRSHCLSITNDDKIAERKIARFNSIGTMLSEDAVPFHDPFANEFPASLRITKSA